MEDWEVEFNRVVNDLEYQDKILWNYYKDDIKKKFCRSTNPLVWEIQSEIIRTKYLNMFLKLIFTGTGPPQEILELLHKRGIETKKEAKVNRFELLDLEDE